jgi:hypothetical protein
MRPRVLLAPMMVGMLIGLGSARSAGGAAVAAGRCPAYGPILAIGRLTAAGIREISGAAASDRDRVLWAEQDSGNPPRIYAVSPNGTMRANVLLRNATNRDWEDIAYANRIVWVGDIGGNRNAMQLYWLREPALATTTAAAKRATLRYPNGEIHNSESMFVDEITHRVVVITKEQSGGRAFLFATSVRRLADGEARVLRRIGTVPFPRPTAADAGPRGFILRGLKGRALFYPWVRGHSILAALGAGPCLIRVGNGEAVAFSRWSPRIYTMPEGGSPMVKSVLLMP